MIYFLDTLYRDDYVNELFKLIPTNILSSEDVDRINGNFQDILHFSESNCHPFSELYNLGILGLVRNNSVDSVKVQSFQSQHEFKWNAGNILPDSEWYLIHPALSEAIRTKNPKYQSNDRIIVGYGREWPAEYDKHARSQRIRIFVSYARRDARLVDNCLADIGKAFDQRGRPHWFWRDVWRIRAGDWVHDAMEKGIQHCEFALVFMTRNAFRSNWVEREWKSSFQRELDEAEITVVPVTNMPTEEFKKTAGPFLKGKETKSIPKRGTEDYRKFIDGIVESFCDLHDEKTASLPNDV